MRVLREGPTKITRATVDAVWRRRARDQRVVIGDAACRGLALVVNSGGMAWTYSYKPRGLDPVTGKRFASRSVTIGSPQTHSPDAARDAANVLKGQAKAGADPAAERRAKIAATAEMRVRTLARLLENYADALPSRPKLRGSGTISPQHAAEEIAHAKAAVAAMGAEDRPVSDVTASDLRTMLKASASVRTAGRRRFGALSRFFDWCQDEGHIALNPCALIAKTRRPKAAAPRAHYLKLDELARLWTAAERLETVHRDLIRFLMAVPCRVGEATRLDWLYLDLAAGVWAQLGSMTKNGDPHRLHLHPLALGILRERHEAAGKPKVGRVFPAPRSGRTVDTFSDIKAALEGQTELTGWRFHDFRRSFATALGEAGVAEPVVDAVLNHRQAATRGGVLGVYQRARRWPEQVRVMQLWGEMLAAALEGRDPGGEVVTLTARRV